MEEFGPSTCKPTPPHPLVTYRILARERLKSAALLAHPLPSPASPAHGPLLPIPSTSFCRAGTVGRSKSAVELRRSEPRQSESRQSESRQSESRQSESRQSESRQSESRQSESRQSGSRQSESRQSAFDPPDSVTTRHVPVFRHLPPHVPVFRLQI